MKEVIREIIRIKRKDDPLYGLGLKIWCIKKYRHLSFSLF
jgi:hypothetical protein